MKQLGIIGFVFALVLTGEGTKGPDPSPSGMSNFEHGISNGEP